MQLCQADARALYLFAEVEGDVAVLDHVLDLPLHGDEEQDAEVEQQDGPEDRHIKHREERREEAKHKRLCGRIPAFVSPMLILCVLAVRTGKKCIMWMIPSPTKAKFSSLLDMQTMQHNACSCPCMDGQQNGIMLVCAHQNLNSGRRRTNGRNSSSDFEGSVGPSSSGSTCGVRNPSSKFKLKMPSAYVTM